MIHVTPKVPSNHLLFWGNTYFLSFRNLFVLTAWGCKKEVQQRYYRRKNKRCEKASPKSNFCISTKNASDRRP